MFDNISVDIDDLKKHKSNIQEYFASDSYDFANEKEVSMKDVYRKVKSRERVNNPLMSDTNLAARTKSIKDFSDTENIKDKVSLLIISKILENNRAFDEAESYRVMSDRIPLNYYIDENSDDAADDDEIENDSGGIKFSR